MIHYQLRKKEHATLDYVTEVVQQNDRIVIEHSIFDGDEYYPVPFDPYAFMTLRDFKWVAAWFWHFGYPIQPFAGKDYVLNGQPSLMCAQWEIPE